MDYSLACLPQDSRSATKSLLDKIRNEIHPLIIRVKDRIHSWTEHEEGMSRIREVYTLCLSQIKKSVLNLLEVFKLEYKCYHVLQESRQCNLERLSWCCDRLKSIERYLERKESDKSNSCEESTNDSFNVTVMYFVNWIDHAFEILSKLAETVYKTDYKENEELYEKWSNDMVECVSGLHVSIDELLLSAMTLCRYCLPNDQVILKVRCQVVLRETKALLSELIVGDLSTTVKATSEALKLPIMPSNVNVMIDVLKDVLYVLETNTNTALLTLLVHCFSSNMSPVEALKQHLADDEKGCSCELNSTDEVTEDCLFVKEFDLFNERLLLIGTFAVSCSSDQNRVLSLRSGLASLEALDPHLVPALMTSPNGYHSTLLIKSWREEVQEIKDNVFLIVDPAAFAEKSKQMMHQKLLELLKETTYNNVSVCSVINIGCVVRDFFSVYDELEPHALPQREKLTPLLADLNKVQLECKVVSNLLCTSDDFTYDVKTPVHKEVTLDQLYKRLKLLYTLVNRINALLQPKGDQLFDEEDAQIKNVTRTILKNVTRTILKNAQTYVNSPIKGNSRSMFARTNARSSTRNVPLSRLTKHLRGKNCSQLNFSVELDRLFNLSNEKENGTCIKKNMLLDRVCEASVLFNFSPIKNRSSMRKTVLNRNLATFSKGAIDQVADNVEGEGFMDENESLQLTEVLNQLNDMTSMLTTTQNVFSHPQNGLDETRNVLSINVNQETESKKIWHIPINFNSYEINETTSNSTASNMTQPSNVTTLERINDLDFVETKLNGLKLQFETSL